MSHLKAKALLQALLLPAILAATLIGTAGTVQYWQAWVYCGVFLIAVLGITLYLADHDPALLARRMKAGSVHEARPTQKLIQAIAGLSFLLVYVTAGWEYRAFGAHWPAAVSLAADGAVAVAFWLVWRVFRENTYTSALIELANNQQVINTGPYHFVRHPMYTGGILLMLATPLALGSWQALAFGVLVTAAIVWRLLDEERFLDQELPGYREYRQQTRYRLIPGIW